MLSSYSMPLRNVTLFVACQKTLDWLIVPQPHAFTYRRCLHCPVPTSAMVTPYPYFQEPRFHHCTCLTTVALGMSKVSQFHNAVHFSFLQCCDPTIYQHCSPLWYMMFLKSFYNILVPRLLLY